MAKTMILNSILISYVALISLVSLSEPDPLTEASITGFTTDLIHRDSPQSPSLSHSQRIVNALKRSFNRVQRLKGRQSRHVPESDIIAVGGEYLMKYSVGTPPVPSLAIADTGSDIIWKQCQPCTECFKRSLPLFKPKSSRTYRKIRCNSTRCSSLPETYCNNNKRNCLYSETHADNSFTYRELATDTFALASAGGKKGVSIPKIAFGCGFSNGGLFSGVESGIIGLGGGKASLVRQLRHVAEGKFSYCLVSLSDQSNSSKVHFGANATVSGRRAVSTPLVKRDPETYYFLTLEGISVGEKRLDFYNHSSSRHHPEGNIIIDSGTTLTLLPADFYAKLENAMKSSIKLKQIKDPQEVLSLCFFTRKDDIKIPEITVHFKGGDVTWKNENVFVRTGEDALCLAAAPENFAIHGNLARINFLVGYDLKKRTVSFKPTDCGR